MHSLSGHNCKLAFWLMFVLNGMDMMDPSYLETIEKAHEFAFVLNRRTDQIRSVACRQLIHGVTGAILARLVVDKKGW